LGILFLSVYFFLMERQTYTGKIIRANVFVNERIKAKTALIYSVEEFEKDTCSESQCSRLNRDTD